MAKQISSRAPVNWRAWLLPVLLWATSIALLVLPLFQPRGQFFWGHYRFFDIYLGWPVALAGMLAAIVKFWPEKGRRLLTFRLAAVWFTVVCTVLAMDFAYAFFIVGAWKPDIWLDQGHITRRYSAADPELGFVRKPNIVWRGQLPGGGRQIDYRTDEQGFRNPPDIKRSDLVFIGDSFTEAAQVAEAETFAARVASQTGLRTTNLGRGAYGPQQELIVLKRYGLSYQPRLVIWQIFEGNDLNDAETFARWRQNPPSDKVPLIHRYIENSLLRLMLEGTRAPEEKAKSATLVFHDGAKLPLPLRYPYEPQQPVERAMGFAETKQSLLEGQRMCRENGVELLVLYVPIMARVMEPWLQFEDSAAREEFLSPGGINQPSDTGHQLADFCAQNGINFLDGFKALRQRAETDNRGLYIPDDEHLDVQGHAVIAEAIRSWLMEKKLARAR